MNRNRFLCVGAIAMLFSALGCGSLAGSHSVKPPVKIMMAGASVTAGFGSMLSLGEIVAVAVDGPVEISNAAYLMFFRSPAAYAEKVLAACQAEPPDVLVGVDLLFWFAYGWESVEVQEAQLRSVLTRLGNMKDCSIVVGDIPAYPPGPMLPRGIIPTDADLKRLNGVIWRWAEGHTNVRVLPLARYMRAMRNSEAVDVSGPRVALNRKDLILFDKLHLSLKGQAFLIAVALEELEDMRAPLSGDWVETDWDQLYSRAAKRYAEKRTKALRGEGGGPTERTPDTAPAQP